MEQRPGQEQLRSDAFSWFYLAINIGALLSQLAVPWLRTAYSYQTAFLFPFFSMALALTFFALGKKFYAKETIERKVVGDPLIDMPLFLDPDWYINIPLEATYQTAWRGVPSVWREVIENGQRPDR